MSTCASYFNDIDEGQLLEEENPFRMPTEEEIFARRDEEKKRKQEVCQRLPWKIENVNLYRKGKYGRTSQST